MIWRDEEGSILAILEVESNETLDLYLSGGVSSQELVAANRAIWSELGVSGGFDDAAGKASGGPPEAEEASDEDDGKGLLENLAGIAYTIFKQIRTGRLLLYKVARDVQTSTAAALATLRKLKRKARGLEKYVAESGSGRAAKALSSVKEEIAALEETIAAQSKILPEANQLVQAEQKAATGFFRSLKQAIEGQGARKRATGFVWRNVWKVVGPHVGRLIRFLRAAPGVAKLMGVVRVLSNPWVGRALIGAAAILEGLNAWATSKNKTTAGKALDAGLSAAGGALVVANPVTAVADLVLPEGYKPSEVYRGGAGAVSAIAEGVATGDIAAMNDFHEASKRGEYGKVMQLSSEAGDYWAEHGVIGGLEEFGEEFIDWLF